MKSQYDDLVAFHGHSCPGLAIGYRMSRAALDRLADARAEDEEIVAEPETPRVVSIVRRPWRSSA